METGCVGTLEFITRQEDWESLDEEFFTVVVDELLGFLDEFYMPL